MNYQLVDSRYPVLVPATFMDVGDLVYAGGKVELYHLNAKRRDLPMVTLSLAWGQRLEEIPAPPIKNKGKKNGC